MPTFYSLVDYVRETGGARHMHHSSKYVPSLVDYVTHLIISVKTFQAPEHPTVSQHRRHVRNIRLADCHSACRGVSFPEDIF